MKLTKAEKGYKLICYSFAILVAVLSLYPLLYTVFVSLCTQEEWLDRNGILLFAPTSPSLIAYAKIFANSGYIVGATLVSVVRSVLGTVIGVFFNICVGYALSRENLPGRKAIMIILMITILFGGGLIPGYITIKEVGLLNNFWVLVIPTLINGWNILIFKQFFDGVPKELEEAAVIDGAGEYRLMTKIIMPTSKSVIAAIALFTFVGHWNSWFDAMIYIDTDHSSLWPLQLYTMLNFNNLSQININQVGLIGGEVTTTAQKMALTVVALLPVLIIYPFFQKFFAKGVYAGAVKG